LSHGQFVNSGAMVLAKSVCVCEKQLKEPVMTFDDLFWSSTQAETPSQNF